MYCRKIALLTGCLFSGAVLAETDYATLFPSRTVYVGVNLGGGSTEWKYLVDTTDPQNNTQGQTPTSVSEGGPSWGLALGYDVSKNFAVEMQYMHFADATVVFDPNSSYAILDNVTSMVSKTEAYSLSGKFLVPVGSKTRLRAFAAVGGALVKRSDVINTASCITPYMSAGLNYSFTKHWMLETGFQYYTGFGASEVAPVDDFIPFAWDAYARIAYQF